jgi:Leucine-rich repeat (LRR) protein
VRGYCKMSKKLEVILENIKINRKEIKKVNLSEQYNLESVPKEIEYCENIESLNISYTSITTIPDFVFKLPKLKHISYLGCSNLVAQPTGYKYAQNLESVKITYQMVILKFRKVYLH